MPGHQKRQLDLFLVARSSPLLPSLPFPFRESPSDSSDNSLWMSKICSRFRFFTSAFSLSPSQASTRSARALACVPRLSPHLFVDLFLPQTTPDSFSKLARTFVVHGPLPSPFRCQAVRCLAAHFCVCSLLIVRLLALNSLAQGVSLKASFLHQEPKNRTATTQRACVQAALWSCG